MKLSTRICNQRETGIRNFRHLIYQNLPTLPARCCAFHKNIYLDGVFYLKSLSTENIFNHIFISSKPLFKEMVQSKFLQIAPKKDHHYVIIFCFLLITKKLHYFLSLIKEKGLPVVSHIRCVLFFSVVVVGVHMFYTK